MSQTMPHMEQGDSIGDRPEWILRLLYAPVEGQKAIPIVGTTRLMKGCFLMHKKLESELNTSTDFEFHPNDYGPLDELVYDAVEQLEQRNLITSRESQRYSGTKYDLTAQGEKEAGRLFRTLTEEEQELLIWVKGRHVLKSLPKLLSFVYNQYPESAESSILK